MLRVHLVIDRLFVLFLLGFVKIALIIKLFVECLFLANFMNIALILVEAILILFSILNGLVRVITCYP